MNALANRVARLEEQLSRKDCNCAAVPIVIAEGDPMPERSCSVHPNGGRLVIIMRRFGSAPVQSHPADRFISWPLPKTPIDELHT